MKILSSTLRDFRDHYCPKEVPDSMLNEQWAERIHGQTLKRLNERGGMGINEIMANINHTPFREIKAETVEMLNELKELIKIHNSTTGK